MSDSGITTLPVRNSRVDEQVQTDSAGPAIRQPADRNRNVQLVGDIDRAHVNDEAYVLICDYINYRLRKAGFVWNDSPPLPAEPSRRCLVMRTFGDEFEQRYSELYHDMCTTLQITPTTAYPTFLQVCAELFRGNGNELEIKWGRILALFAFAGALAVQCVDKEMPQQVSNIAEWVMTFSQTHLSQWISENGGWDGFVQFCEKGSPDDRWSSFRKVMTGVGVACGAVGVATLAGFLVGRP